MLHFQQHRFRMFFFFFAQMRSYSGHYDVIYYPFLVVCEGLLTARKTQRTRMALIT